ncbi:hypothetical protein [Neorhizobium sp. DAR64861/K0K2]|uniref:hypothetical protein n=1 Tax=unclassified Neorhizobium TaxID=2629175 RepID=UPI003D2B651D
MKIDDDMGYWMGWITAVVVAVFSIAALGVFMFLRQEFCTGAEDEQCVREWTAALGGWAAVPAAAVTVIFLSRQIASADAHHRENARLAKQPLHGLIRRAFDLSAELAGQCAAVSDLVDLEDRHEALQRAVLSFRTIKQLLERGTFQALENNYGLIARFSADFRLRGVEDVIIRLESLTGEPIDRYPAESWKALYHAAIGSAPVSVREFAEQVRDRCTELIMEEEIEFRGK